MRRLSRLAIGAPREGLAGIDGGTQSNGSFAGPVDTGYTRRIERKQSKRGSNRDSSDWGDSGRLETDYGEQARLLMEAMDDERAMRSWAGGTGWAGLIRALFLTLRSEQDERPEDPNHVPWRLEWMKEKYGQLDVVTMSSTKYQEGAVLFLEAMSAYVCLHCGAPGEIRNAPWIRPECDACWAKADEKSRAFERAWRESWRARGASPPNVFRGTEVAW